MINLKNLLEDAAAQGVTRYQIWQETGIQQSTLQHIANGDTTRPRIDTYEKIIQAVDKLTKKGDR